MEEDKKIELQNNINLLSGMEYLNLSLLISMFVSYFFGMTWLIPIGLSIIVLLIIINGRRTLEKKMKEGDKI